MALIPTSQQSHDRDVRESLPAGGEEGTKRGPQAVRALVGVGSNRVPHAARVLVGGAGLLAIAIGTAVVGGQASAPVAILAGVVFTLPLCSLGEWLVHRVLYHGRVPGLGFLRRIHQQGHHVALFPPARYLQHGPHPFMNIRAPLLPFRMAGSRLDSALTEGSQVALHFAAGVPLILVPAWLLAGGRPAFLAACFGTLSLVSFALAHVHGAMHTPRDRWIEHQRWFRWLDRRHYLHHLDVRVNLNFMLPLCDGLFGTHRTPPAQHPYRSRSRAPQPHATVAG